MSFELVKNSTDLYIKVLELIKDGQYEEVAKLNKPTYTDEERKTKALAEDFLLFFFLKETGSMSVEEIDPLVRISLIENNLEMIELIKKTSLKELTSIISPEAEKSSKWEFIDSEGQESILLDETAKVKTLKEHLTNTNAEIDHYGAVYTDYRLIDKMYDQLDEVYKKIYGHSIFSNVENTFVDPACGSGSFLICLKERLIKGLKFDNGFQEENHILNNMIFGSEIQKKQFLICKKILNYKNRQGISLNVNLGDSLSFNFWNKQYTAVVGNPPYQESMDDGSRKAKNHNLWEQFIIKGLEITEENGFLVYIVPTSWMSPAWKYMDETFRRYTVHYLEINTIQDYFPGVGSQFCWFIIQKTPPVEGVKTVIKSKFDGVTYELEEEFRNIRFFANLLSKESVSIMNKFYGQPEVFNFMADSALHSSNKKQFLSKEKTETNIHPIKHTSSKMLYSSILHPVQSSKKLLITKSGNYQPEYDSGLFGVSEATMYSIVDTDEEGLAKLGILNSKVSKFIFKICKWSGFNIQKVFQNIPYLQLENYDDKSIYEALGLTEEEIKQIEKVIK